MDPGTIISLIENYLINPAKPYVTRTLNYKSNLKNLDDEVKELESVLGNVQQLAREADYDYGLDIKKDVMDWLKEAEQMISADQRRLTEDQERAKKNCFFGVCPNFITRYKVSKVAEVEKDAVVRFREKGGGFDAIDKVSHRPTPEASKPRTVEDYEAFGSRSSVVEKIKSALTVAGVNRVGVYGLGGVGKTTLVKEVAKQVMEDRSFDAAVIVEVTEKPDVEEIQKKIAKQFGLVLDDQSERASRLQRRLSKEKKLLVVLDDLWKKLDIQDIGIPSQDEHKGLRILMTSRNREVLSSMGAEEEGSKFNLEALNDTEAQNLFMKKAGDDVAKDKDLKSIAIKVAKECGGLPVILVTIAGALKGADLQTWRDALRRLKRFDKDNYSALKLSYDMLPGNEIKSLFLVCAQLGPKRISVTRKLLKYAKGLGLFEYCHTLEETRDRLHVWVNKLKACCLLLEGDSDDEVKMHDVVRKFAVSVSLASKVRPVFIVDNDGLQEWPAKEKLRGYTGISLPYCEIPDLPAEPECPKLESFFLLREGTPSMEVPDNFFRSMTELKVIDLTAVTLLALPSSLRVLQNLHTLCLDLCNNLKHITGIGELKSLHVLSMAGSSIFQLPEEIKQLTSLQMLDLCNCTRLEIIPPNVLSCLTQLEELCMEGICLRWGEEVEDPTSRQTRRNASLDELKHMSKLTALDIHIADPTMLPRHFSFEKLERFRIFIGEGWDWSGTYETSRTLKLDLDLEEDTELGKELKELIKITEDLYLYRGGCINYVLYQSNMKAFPQLKSLKIDNSLELEDNALPPIAFPRLKSLVVDRAGGMEKIYRRPLRDRSFQNLRFLEVANCDDMRYVISLSVARDLLQLEGIEVTDCAVMQEIVGMETEEDDLNKVDQINWTRLSSLILDELPELKGFCTKGKIVFPNLEELKLLSLNWEKIWDGQVVDQYSSSFERLTSLTVTGCPNLSFLFTASIAKNLVLLKQLEVSNCNLMNEILVTEEVGDGPQMSTILFPKLELLNLKDLPHLKRFCKSNSFEFQSLKNLRVENCPETEVFISSFNGAKDRATRGKAHVTNSTLFDEKVSFPELEELQIANMNRLKNIWNDKFHEDSFGKLKRLELVKAQGIEKIFPSSLNISSRFRSLENLLITDCDSLGELFEEASSIEGSQLTVLTVRRLPKLTSLFPISMAKSLERLEKLEATECGIEEIVAKEGSTEGGVGRQIFEFPRLTHLELGDLPNLRGFYAENHTLECPALKQIIIGHCKELQKFDWEIQSCGKESSWVQVQKPLLSAAKVIPKLETLTLNSMDVEMIRQADIATLTDRFCSVKVLRLQCFHSDSAVFPADLLLSPHFFKLEKLFVGCSWFKEVSSEEEVTGVVKERNTPGRIKYLRLDKVENLELFWKEDSHVDYLLQNLETLEVWRCRSVSNLAPLSASFRSLTTLDIWSCNGMESLFTSSRAKYLEQLKELSVRECEMVKEIVSDGGIQSPRDDETTVNFGKLERLTLDRLPRLTSFCSEDHRFKFPSLVTVIVHQCPEMGNFSNKAYLSTPMLQRVGVTIEETYCIWWDDLDSTISLIKQEREQQGFRDLPQLNLSQFPTLQNIWHSTELQWSYFRKLKSLVVEECASFTEAISYSLLLYLNNLEELDVRKCEMLEVVFYLGDEQASKKGRVGLLPKLERLHLTDLPSLESIFDTDPRGKLKFKNLRVLKVDRCRSLDNVFTPSMAMDLLVLEEMEIRNCANMETIIAGESGEEAAIDKIIFPALKTVVLDSLPTLRSVYEGSGILDFPSLSVITINKCPHMKEFVFPCPGESSTGKGGDDYPTKLLFNEKARIIVDSEGLYKDPHVTENPATQEDLSLDNESHTKLHSEHQDSHETTDNEGQVPGQPMLPSSSEKLALDFETAQAENEGNEALVILDRVAAEKLSIIVNPSADKHDPLADESANKLVTEDHSIRSSLRGSEITQFESNYEDPNETSNDRGHQRPIFKDSDKESGIVPREPNLLEIGSSKNFLAPQPPLHETDQQLPERFVQAPAIFEHIQTEEPEVGDEKTSPSDVFPLSSPLDAHAEEEVQPSSSSGAGLPSNVPTTEDTSSRSSIYLASTKLLEEISSITDAGGPPLDNEISGSTLAPTSEYLQNQRKALRDYFNMPLEDIHKANAFDDIERISSAIIRESSSLHEKKILEDLPSRLAEFREKVPKAMLMKDTAEAYRSSQPRKSTDLQENLAVRKDQLRMLAGKMSKVLQEKAELETEIQRIITRKEALLDLEKSISSEMQNTYESASRDVADWRNLKEEAEHVEDNWYKGEDMLIQANASWALLKRRLGLGL